MIANFPEEAEHWKGHVQVTPQEKAAITGLAGIPSFKKAANPSKASKMGRQFQEMMLPKSKSLISYSRVCSSQLFWQLTAVVCCW